MHLRAAPAQQTARPDPLGEPLQPAPLPVFAWQLPLRSTSMSQKDGPYDAHLQANNLHQPIKIGCLVKISSGTVPLQISHLCQ